MLREAVVHAEPEEPAVPASGARSGHLKPLEAGIAGFIMRAERVGADTLLAQIVRLVGEAQRSRAPIQRLADTISTYFVPAVVAIAAVTFLIWALVGPEPRLAHALVSAVSVLLIACPCALGLATPVSILVATGIGARAGVLFRSASAIEVLRQVDTLVVDKTGTLTAGKPRLVTVVPAPGWAEDAVLRFAAGVEQASEHGEIPLVFETAVREGVQRSLGRYGRAQSTAANGRNLRRDPPQGVARSACAFCRAACTRGWSAADARAADVRTAATVRAAADARGS